MPRRARLILPNVAVHVIQRGHNRQACFYQNTDYLTYLDWLHAYANECDCSIHAYVLMTNHVHILSTPARAESLGLMMKRLGQRYAQYINRRYERSGALWEGRYRSCLTDSERYLLGCYRYIELNPVRAGMVDNPANYRWSSYRNNALGESDDIIEPHPVYIALHEDKVQRTEAYRKLFEYRLENRVIDEIRNATNGNLVVGSKQFQREVEQAMGRPVTRGQPGRPPCE